MFFNTQNEPRIFQIQFVYLFNCWFGSKMLLCYRGLVSKERFSQLKWNVNVVSY